MRRSIVITGIGLVTPLGSEVPTLWRRIEAGDSAATPPAHFDAAPFACRVCAEIRGFEPGSYVPEGKLVRLMNREAQLAVAAAHRALEDAGLKRERPYRPEDIGLFGATGLAGLPLAEVAPLIQASARADGRFDPNRFATEGLRAVRPILSFKVLSNMPLCFVSICENLQGPNAVYTPWEGQGAQAIEAAVQALECGEVRSALAGGCDVKTHELAFLALQQQGAFASWRERGAGPTPGEGAAFLILEDEGAAKARGARVHARLSGFSLATRPRESGSKETYARILEAMGLRGQSLTAVVAAGNGDPAVEQAENEALAMLQVRVPMVVQPKKHMGDLFAAAGPAQVGLAAALAARRGGCVLANCFGHGSEQAAFLLEPP
ncbi:MAG TPA: beta-ketoacyl synthase N-terminal-like domain-containing protein [Verrucomicrobiota bacterium]|nr:beta-ketoacyl synthase N-terminal-like domain-containing protein [Verrucomicrobiota bacterium]HNU52793.1 beta-ketoacyl synthase N-terminal-like domain-containing protein [Verrucomicrobiota bacterium]